jgi:hypothetical protein
MNNRAGGVCTLIIAWVMTLGGPAAAFAADTVLIHGHIYTGNSQAPWATALAVSGTRIEAVGSDAAIQ